MKKITLSLLLFGGFVTSTIAQTIVPTTQQNKKIILEEFTGIHCTYCPDGHARANAIVAANPGNAFVINIHVGSFATPSVGEPDFRTAFGTAIAGQTGLTGYPSGTVNRTIFAGLGMPNTSGVIPATTTAMGRGNWLNASNQTKIIPSYVNVAAEATIDVNTRLLTVHVESYYTAGSPVASNKLNVALLQNNTTGTQTGGGQGSEYNHQHRLVHMLTGQWGADITTTTAGTFVDRTYTYTIPASYVGVPAVLGDFEIVAYVAEGNQKIVSGNGAIPTYLNLTTNDAKVYSVKPILDQCISSMSPKITIQNNGTTTLTSLPITYNINGGANQVYNWSGSLSVLARANITLPNINYTILGSNSLNISLPTDNNISNNTGSVSFNKAVESNNTLTLNIQPDAYGSEIGWDIKNAAGSIIANGGPYTDGDTTLITVPVNLPSDDCYTFTMTDAYGDGLDAPGYVTLTDSNSFVVSNITGNYGSSVVKNFATGAFLGTDSFEKNTVSLYPNPTNGILRIKTETAVDVVITDITGKVVYTAKDVNNDASFNLSSLQKGIYFARINNGNKEKVEKIILN
jgi:hypothetical protein